MRPSRRHALDIGGCRRWRDRQLYYLLFNVSGFEGLRAALGQRAGPAFKPDALAPVLMMAAQPDFTGWMPIGADAGCDCIAPVEVE